MNLSAPDTACKKAKSKYNKAKMVKINTNVVKTFLQRHEKDAFPLEVYILGITTLYIFSRISQLI